MFHSGNLLRKSANFSLNFNSSFIELGSLFLETSVNVLLLGWMQSARGGVYVSVYLITIVLSMVIDACDGEAAVFSKEVAVVECCNMRTEFVVK
jgi:hypothetical protein